MASKEEGINHRFRVFFMSSGQKERIQWWRTEFSKEEIFSIMATLSHERISQGPETAEFERECATLLGVPYAVATTSGTMALTLSLLSLGVGPGDEVIVPNRTFIATAHAALVLGARVVLVDTCKDLPLIDISQLEAKITPRTKAIIPVHLNGRAVDIKALRAVIGKRGIPIVEDAAQAFLSATPNGCLGSEGTIGCYSLGMTKLVSTGQGGLMVTSDPAIDQKLRLARNHGVVDVFEATYTELGFNGKYNDIAAAFGRAQIRRSEQKKSYVIHLYNLYQEAIDELDYIEMIPVDIARGELPLWVEVAVADREKFKGFLNERNIDTRKYLPNLNIAPHLKNEGRFPNSEFFQKHGIFLPSGPGQPMDNVRKAIDALRDYGRLFPNERIEQFKVR